MAGEFVPLIDSERNINMIIHVSGDFPGKESACQCRRCQRHRFDPWFRKGPWRRIWRPAPLFLENSTDKGDWLATVHGFAKKLDMTE